MRGITNIPGEGGTSKVIFDSLVINEATTANDFIDLVLNKFYSNTDLRELEVINNSTAISLTGDASNSISITGKVLIKALSNAIVEPETTGNLVFEIVQTMLTDNTELALLSVYYSAADTYTYSVSKIKGASTETRIPEPAAANLGYTLMSKFGVGERKYFIASTGYTYPAQQEISGSEAFTTIAGDAVYFEDAKIYGASVFNVTIYRNDSGTLKKFVGFAKYTLAGTPPSFQRIGAFIGMHEEGQGGGGEGKTVVDSINISESTTEQAIHSAVFAKFFANTDLRSVIVTIEDGATVTSSDLPIYPGDVLQYIGDIDTPSTFPATLKLDLTVFKSGISYTPTTPRHTLSSKVTGVFSDVTTASFSATMFRYKVNKQDTFPTTQALMSTIFNQLQNDFDLEYYLTCDQYTPYTADAEIAGSVAFDFYASDNITVRWAGYGEFSEHLLKIELVRADGKYSGIVVKKTVTEDDVPVDHIALVEFHKEVALPEIFTIHNQTLTFTNDVATISDARVTANSLVDVYYADASLSEAKAADITVTTGSGAITFTASNTPSTTITASVKVTN